MLSVEDEKGSRGCDGPVCISKTGKEAASLLLLWSSGTLGRGSQGRVSGKGDQGGLGGLERLPGGVC